MKLKDCALIMTGTINPDIFSTNGKKINVVLSSASERLKQYEDAICLYIKESAFTDIIFIENSNYPFDSSKYCSMAESYGKRFEFITMPLSEEQISTMLKKGKSYGEALLIDYAVKNSLLIQNFDEFYKVTGRVFIQNSHTIVRGNRQGISQFIVKNPHKHSKKANWFYECMLTVFFKVTKEDYFSTFTNSAYLCDDYTKGLGIPVNNIEQVWYRLAKNSMLNIKSFSVYPAMCGIQASSPNVNYDQSSIKIFIKSILCKLGYFSLKLK